MWLDDKLLDMDTRLVRDADMLSEIDADSEKLRLSEPVTDMLTSPVALVVRDTVVEGDFVEVGELDAVGRADEVTVRLNDEERLAVDEMDLVSVDVDDGEHVREGVRNDRLLDVEPLATSLGDDEKDSVPDEVRLAGAVSDSVGESLTVADGVRVLLSEFDCDCVNREGLTGSETVPVIVPVGSSVPLSDADNDTVRLKENVAVLSLVRVGVASV